MRTKEALDTRHRGAVIKHNHFFDIYDSHLSHLQDKKEFKILEIGVYNGGSLFMWKNYFPHADIIGIDIDSYTKRWIDEKRDIKIHIGDQCDIKFLQKVVDEEGPFDLIIDDGGHENNQIITSLEFLFDHLKEDGIYVVEDTFASYYPEYSCDKNKDTFNNPLNPILKSFDPKKTSMEFLKNLTDKLNCWAYRDKEAKHLKKKGKLDSYEKGIYAIHFYDSIVFINKFPRPGSKSFGKDKWYNHVDEQKEFHYNEIEEEWYNGYGYKEEAKSYVNSLNLKNQKEWKK